jgi:hypothetical protein
MNNIIDTLTGGKAFEMEQKITIDNQTTLKLFALAAAIIGLYFVTKKYLN